mmetsp:Transcript_7481/g.10761  ORF Transcript_7481/g.10761 Transcript_7481/m.10761 type:complete len:346 (+) Transcript_7481:119-1156(+)
MAALKAQSPPAQAMRSATDLAAAKKKPALKRKPSTSVTSPNTLQSSSSDPPKEYNEFIEMLDHTVNYDWTTAGLLLTHNKSEVHLQEEQRKLLYNGTPPPPKLSSGLKRGWSSRNLISSRTAWAKVRLPELDREMKESKSATVVVGGQGFPSTKPDPTKIKTVWVNEEQAEGDLTLAVISEATNIYLKSIMSKAVECARQRENLNGIRLWHMQHSKQSTLGMRLGCDVSRQFALREGNAAYTVKRMEQALERQHRPVEQRDLKNQETLEQANSMGDLACRPKLATAVEDADYYAKRQFEVSGGREAGLPPFGKVPKKPKLMPQDFEMGLELSGVRRPRRVALNFV